MASSYGAGLPCFFELLGLTENTVDRCSAYWALALCHAATWIRNVNHAFEVALRFALHTVGITLVSLVCLCHFLASYRRMR